jgi:hypothetical protein
VFKVICKAFERSKRIVSLKQKLSTGNLMSLSNLNLFKSAILCGSLFSLSISSVANAVPMVNPCPRIYYEEPHNTTRIVPLGCPANEATKAQSDRMILPTIKSTSPMSTSILKEQRAIATVIPQSGQITMRLKNTMQTMVNYQALGETGMRSLQSGEEILMQNLPLPITLTLNRADGGLVKVVPMSNEREGILGIAITEANGLSDSQLNILVQSEGQVYAY